VALALALAIIGALFLRRQRAQLGLGADGWLWAVFALYGASLLVTYILTPYDLTWHLATSLTRVVTPLILLACTSAAGWVAVALARPPTRHAAGTGDAPAVT
jgi:hypothetical protein